MVNCMLKSVAIRWTLVAASLGLLAVAVFVMSEGVAFTHFLGYDSVDDCEIRWDDDTAYDTERVTAINAWNALTGDDDCVEILEDTILTITDLIWTDQYRDDVPWIGLYVPRSIADLAILNEYHMDQHGACTRKYAAMHEQGHALGLDHSYGSNVMSTGGSQCTLGTHDIDDYEELWVNLDERNESL